MPINLLARYLTRNIMTTPLISNYKDILVNFKLEPETIKSLGTRLIQEANDAVDKLVKLPEAEQTFGTPPLLLSPSLSMSLQTSK
jgi:hypothetical protein